MIDVTGMLDRIRQIADSLPDHVPTTLHVGPYVLDVLTLTATSVCGGPASGTPNITHAFGAQIIPDPDMPAGSWRFVGQHGQELRAGNLWPPHLPVHETGHLPADTAAVVYTPPDDILFGGEACVFVRTSGHPTGANHE